MGTPEYLYDTAGNQRALVYIHNCYDGEHHITATKHALYYEALVEKESGKIEKKNLQLFNSTDKEILSVQSIGNTLIAVCSETTYYLLYKNGQYLFLGEKPDMPEISFFPHITYTDAYWVDEYTFMETYYNPTRLEMADRNYFNDAYYNAFFQLQENAWKKYTFIQPVLIRYAVTLYDGSQIFSSSPVMISLPEPIQPCQLEIRLKSSNELCSGSYRGQILAENYCIKYHIHRLNLDNWKDIVRSVDFFVAPETTIFEPDQKQQGLEFTIERIEENETITFYLKGDISFLDKKEIQKQYLQAPLFYKIASIEDWSGWKEGDTYEIEHEIRPDQLVHEEILSPDNTTLLSTGAQVSYVHDKRLHLANLKKKMFPGFPLSLFTTGKEFAETAEAYICTSLKTERGECKVVWSGVLNYFCNQISPLLSYPDSNAYKMEIAVKSNTGIYRKSFDLTPSEYENRADYLDESLTAIVLGQVSSSGEFSIPTPYNDTYEQPNILRVSKYENPFIFPAEQTYSASNSNITGIATITAALSEGQFGEFPLYLFTEEGIWALQNGTGGACYSAQHQLSRESIPKGYPIVPLEGSIVFYTQKGLSILRGSEVQPLLSFDEFPYENNDPIRFHHTDYELLQSAYDSTPLSDYIKGCSIAYNTVEKELVCCKPELDYSLVIHLPTLYMYRSTRVYTSLFYDASHLLAQTPSGQVYDLQKESYDSPMPIVLMSRPISLQNEGYQKWEKVIWRLSAQEGGITVSLWGGNDARNKMAQIYKMSVSGRIPELVPRRVTGPVYRYYRLVLSGEVASDFHLTGVDVLFRIISDNNRLY